MTEGYLDKVLGCIIGSAVGDSLGMATEFRTPEYIHGLLNGKEWIEDMMPLKGIGAGPQGIWLADAPRGTGTDDTRYNHIFIQCVIKNKGYINPQLLAMEYVERYRNLKKYVPDYFTEEDIEKIAVPFYRRLYLRGSAFLGIDDPETYDGLPLWVARNLPTSPSLSGLISLQSAGLLYADASEKAYKKAYELSLVTDVGFAHDATAALAATVSAALSERTDPLEILEIGMKTNPFRFNYRRISDGPPPGRVAASTTLPYLPMLLKMAEESKDDGELIVKLGRACECLQPFDAFDALCVPLTVIRYCKGDPVRSIILAANHKRVDEEGRLIRFRDTDCIAMVAGTIVGAIHGLSGFPKDWVRDTIEANKKVYDIDIEKDARDFYHAVYQ